MLLGFAAGKPQVETRVTGVRQMEDRDFMKMWIEDQAANGEKGRASASGYISGLFGFGGR